jgi:hypothetical protein
MGSKNNQVKRKNKIMMRKLADELEKQKKIKKS